MPVKKPRKNMKPEDRKNQILDCAQGLFFERGYDNTTVNDILKVAKVSKGGFYHHYASKSELLYDLGERLAQQSASVLQPVLELVDKPALERLNLVFSETRRMKKAEVPALVASFRMLFREENASLYMRINRAVSKAISPIISTIIQDGIEEGIFKVTDARATADMIISIGGSSHELLGVTLDTRGTEFADQAAEQLKASLDLQNLTIDRLLGIPDGSIHPLENGLVEALMSEPIIE